MSKRLREILNTVPEIKKDLEELKQWCKIRNIYDTYTIIDNKKYVVKVSDWWKFRIDIPKVSKMEKMKHLYFNGIRVDEIIWNPLEERHLRMYIKKRINKLIMFLGNWEIIECIHSKQDINSTEHTYIFKKLITKLDDTKSLNDQTDEVKEQICDFLENNIT